MSVSPPPPLRRPSRGHGRVVLGVCAALAARWGVSPGLVRLIAAVGALTGVGVLVYLGVAAATPVAGTDGPPLAPPRVTAGLANGLMLAIRGAAWFFVAVGLGLVAGGLTLVGLGGVAFAVVAVLTAAALVPRVAETAPVALLVVATALPAAAVALTRERVDRSSGLLVARPATPADIPAGGYVRGAGTVLVDLRGFRAAPGSTTRIAARSDMSGVDVALPRDRCFALDVRWHIARGRIGDEIATWADAPGLVSTSIAGWNDIARRSTFLNSTGLTRAAMTEEQARSATVGWRPTGLRAYGRVLFGAQGRYVRAAAGEPDAPRLVLDLTAPAAPTVRDYPRDAAVAGAWAGSSWPDIVAPPPTPDAINPAWTREHGSARIRARWARWDRANRRFAASQARRMAGACAPRRELALRAWPTGRGDEEISALDVKGGRA